MTTPLHPPTLDHLKMWVGTDIALMHEVWNREPTQDEFIELLYASVCGEDGNQLRARIQAYAAPPPVDPPKFELPRIYADGVDLKDDTGRWFAKGCTDFLLYKRFLDGEDIGPVLTERSDLGANILRVFGMVNSFAKWHPQDYGDRYYDSLPAFCDVLASHFLYLYFTVFADTRLVMPNKDDQRRHWDRVIDALKQRPNTIVEVGNELDQHDNAVDADIPKPDGILACRGSLGGDVPCAVPSWGLSDFHARRDYPKAVVDMCILELRDGYSGYAGTHDALWHGEPQGFGTNPKRWADPRKARELAGTARGTSCGIFFHSDNGVSSQPFDDVTKACAVAFFAELKGL